MPGQILYIQSAPNYFYISIMRSMQQHPVVDDANRYEINTCCDLCVDLYGGEMYPSTITFAGGCVGSSYDVNVEFDEVRPVHDFEKKLLFDRLVYEFKSYDPKWKHHFTDSSYFDILDWLASSFNVDLDSESVQKTHLGETISEIQNYIWDALCKETGNYHACTNYVEPKMVSLDKVEEFLESCMFNAVIIEDGKEVPDEIIVIKYKSVAELIDGLRKAMEE